MPVVAIPIEAAKSAAPKAIDSILLLERAMSFTLVMPAALSIIISKPTFFERAAAFSTADTRESTA